MTGTGLSNNLRRLHSYSRVVAPDLTATDTATGGWGAIRRVPCISRAVLSFGRTH